MQYSLLNSVYVDYTNYILTYKDTRLAPQYYAFHLVEPLAEEAAKVGGPLRFSIVKFNSNGEP